VRLAHRWVVVLMKTRTVAEVISCVAWLGAISTFVSAAAGTFVAVSSRSLLYNYGPRQSLTESVSAAKTWHDMQALLMPLMPLLPLFIGLAVELCISPAIVIGIATWTRLQAWKLPALACPRCESAQSGGPGLPLWCQTCGGSMLSQAGVKIEAEA
jgi:hypothetical protein